MITEAPHWRTLDEKGIQMPWYTRSCLEWLVTLPLGTMLVFEYGCGESSKWFTENCDLSFGVDSNSEWLPKLSGYDLSTTKEEYLSAIEQYVTPEGFDLIIIDGDYRDDCTEHALKHLKKGGYLICDNFEQPSADLAHWPKTRELTKNMPVMIYKEPGHPDWQTAVFHNV